MRDVLQCDHYPLGQPDSAAWSALVETSRQVLERDGLVDLSGFLRPNIAKDIANSLKTPFATDAFSHARDHNIYFKPSLDGVPADHPALQKLTTSNRTLCTDQLGATPLTALYEWKPFQRFLAALLDKPVLYPMTDPLAGVNVMAYSAGQALNWHFDRSEFTTTLLLQSPEKGGTFEYRTDLRTASDPNYDGVARLLRGEDPEVQSVDPTPGTLTIFRGKNTAHRVTPVKGATDRMIAVFSYFEQPGTVFSPEERIGFYGRAE